MFGGGRLRSQPGGRTTPNSTGCPILSRWVYGALPREAVCTENLTPWLGLLPCAGSSGLALLMDRQVLYGAPYHSMRVQLVRSIPCLPASSQREPGSPDGGRQPDLPHGSSGPSAICQQEPGTPSAARQVADTAQQQEGAPYRGSRKTTCADCLPCEECSPRPVGSETTCPASQHREPWTPYALEQTLALVLKPQGKGRPQQEQGLPGHRGCQQQPSWDLRRLFKRVPKAACWAAEHSAVHLLLPDALLGHHAGCNATAPAAAAGAPRAPAPHGTAAERAGSPASAGRGASSRLAANSSLMKGSLPMAANRPGSNSAAAAQDHPSPTPAADSRSASPVALRWPPAECTEAAGGTLHTYTLPPLSGSRTGSALAAGASNSSEQAVSGSQLAQVGLSWQQPAGAWHAGSAPASAHQWVLGRGLVQSQLILHLLLPEQEQSSELPAGRANGSAALQAALGQAGARVRPVCLMQTVPWHFELKWHTQELRIDGQASCAASC